MSFAYYSYHSDSSDSSGNFYIASNEALTSVTATNVTNTPVRASPASPVYEEQLYTDQSTTDEKGLFTCLICLEDCQLDALVTPCCGILVCRLCILPWLEQRPQCPHCRKELQSSDLVKCPWLSQVRKQLSQKNTTTSSSNQSMPSCPRHFELCRYFCDSCQRPVCSDCVILTKDHSQHAILPLKDILSEFHQFCSTLQTLANETLSQCWKRTLQLTDRLAQLQEMRHYTTRQLVRSHREAMDALESQFRQSVRLISQQRQHWQQEKERITQCMEEMQQIPWWEWWLEKEKRNYWESSLNLVNVPNSALECDEFIDLNQTPPFQFATVLVTACSKVKQKSQSVIFYDSEWQLLIVKSDEQLQVEMKLIEIHDSFSLVSKLGPLTDESTLPTAPISLAAVDCDDNTPFDLCLKILPTTCFQRPLSYYFHHKTMKKGDCVQESVHWHILQVGFIDQTCETINLQFGVRPCSYRGFLQKYIK